MSPVAPVLLDESSLCSVSYKRICFAQEFSGEKVAVVFQVLPCHFGFVLMFITLFFLLVTTRKAGSHLSPLLYLYHIAGIVLCFRDVVT